MKKYFLQASLNGSITTQEIQARDTFSAKVFAVQKINANRVSDKRYKMGSIILKTEEGKVVWKLPELIEGEKI